MNDLDRRIKSILNEKLEIPEKYDNMIFNTLNSLPEKEQLTLVSRNKFKISFATACCILCLATSIVFAEEITAFIKHIFNYSKGLDKAVESGYIENTNIETIKSNGTVITAENFLMDDFNLSFTFKVDLENQELLNDTSKIEFLDLLITDEENRILYCEDKERFNEYCTNNNLDYKYREFNENYISSGMNKYIKNKEDNEISAIYNLYADKFPKSKKLFIDVSKIKCASEKNENSSEVILEGNWNIELDVPEKFYNRECAVYTVTSCSEPTINVTDMTVYNTGTRFEFVADINSIYDETDSEEVKQDKIREFNIWYKNNIKENIQIISYEYIEDENGNKYYPIRSNTSDKNIKYEANGELSYYQTFDLIQYENVNKIKIHFKINLQNETKEVVIDLERNS